MTGRPDRSLRSTAVQPGSIVWRSVQRPAAPDRPAARLIPWSSNSRSRAPQPSASPHDPLTPYSQSATAPSSELPAQRRTAARPMHRASKHRRRTACRVSAWWRTCGPRPRDVRPQAADRRHRSPPASQPHAATCACGDRCVVRARFAKPLRRIPEQLHAPPTRRPDGVGARAAKVVLVRARPVPSPNETPVSDPALLPCLCPCSGRRLSRSTAGSWRARRPSRDSSCSADEGSPATIPVQCSSRGPADSYGTPRMFRRISATGSCQPRDFPAPVSALPCRA